MSSNVECVMNILDREKEKEEEEKELQYSFFFFYFRSKRGIIENWKMVNKTNENNALDANKVERNCCRHCTGDI